MSTGDAHERERSPRVAPKRRKRTLAEVRTLVVGRLRERRPELEEAIVARVLERVVEPTSDANAEYIAGLRAAVRGAVDYALTGIEHGQPAGTIPAQAVEQAQRAARAGVGLDTVLRRYLAGHALLTDFVMQALDADLLADQRVAARGLLGSSASVLDRLLPPVTTAYRDELARLARTTPAAAADAATAPAAPPTPAAVNPLNDAIPGARTRARAIHVSKTTSHPLPLQTPPPPAAPRTASQPHPSSEPPPPPAPPHPNPSRSASHPDPSPDLPLSQTPPAATAGGPRDRILQAIVAVVGERGFADATVGAVIAHAKVSRRTFYSQFTGLQDGFLAVLDLALERPAELIAGAFAEERRWQDGLLRTLATLLVYFDSEPALARIWFVEAMAAGAWSLQRREQIAAQLRAMVVAHWPRRLPSPDPRSAAGAMGSVLGLIQTQLVTEAPEPLIELLGPLIGLIGALYLDQAGAAREARRGARFAHEIRAGKVRWEAIADLQQPVAHPVAALPAMLTNPSARRARECVRFLATHPDASNREIAAAVGVAHQSQISRLLSTLHDQQLVARRSGGAGTRNEWRLTPCGVRAARALAAEPQTLPAERRPASPSRPRRPVPGEPGREPAVPASGARHERPQGARQRA